MILYISTFNKDSIALSQYNELKSYDTVIKCNYTNKSNIVSLCKNTTPSFVLFNNLDNLDPTVISKCNNYTKTILYFSDVANHHQDHRLEACIKYSSFVFCDDYRQYELSLGINVNSYYLPLGYDPLYDKPYNLHKDITVSVIGDYNKDLIDGLGIKVYNKTSNKDYAKIVSRSKINLNICKNYNTTRRIYRVMAAGGFLLTNDWYGSENFFDEGVHFGAYINRHDIKEVIEYYLNNPTLIDTIATRGKRKVEEFAVSNWAKKILTTLRK